VVDLKSDAGCPHLEQQDFLQDKKRNSNLRRMKARRKEKNPEKKKKNGTGFYYVNRESVALTTPKDGRLTLRGKEGRRIAPARPGRRAHRTGEFRRSEEKGDGSAKTLLTRGDARD